MTTGLDGQSGRKLKLDQAELAAGLGSFVSRRSSEGNAPLGTWEVKSGPGVIYLGEQQLSLVPSPTAQLSLAPHRLAECHLCHPI